MSNPTDVAADKAEPAAVTSGPPIAATPLADRAGTETPTAASATIEPAKVVIPEAAAPIVPAPEPPPMPRVAVLPPKPDAPPVVASSADGAAVPPTPAGPVTAGREGPRGSRFALLAACVAVAASLGAIAGSLGVAGLHHETPVAAPAVRHEAGEEVRALKETVAQLRANVKSLNDSLAALRTSINTSTSTANAQFAKITETLDRVERTQERRVTTLTPSPEPTGSIAPAGAGDSKSAAKPPIIEDWIVRKIYDGSALVEGRRYGIIEIAPGDPLPGIGRVQEIKRQDGQWVVVTPKGLIVQRR